MFDPITPFLNIVDPVRIVIELFKQRSEKANKDKENYAEKLENANGDNVFKYMLLINIAALEGYVAQTRLQAAQSFRLSQIVAVTGFLIIATGLIFGIYLSLHGDNKLDMAYLTAGAGIITEFISGVFFYLYNKTLQQINRFHDKLVIMQQMSMSLLASSLVSDQAKKDDAKIHLAQGLISPLFSMPQTPSEK